MTSDELAVVDAGVLILQVLSFSTEAAMAALQKVRAFSK